MSKFANFSKSDDKYQGECGGSSSKGCSLEFGNFRSMPLRLMFNPNNKFKELYVTLPHRNNDTSAGYYTLGGIKYQPALMTISPLAPVYKINNKLIYGYINIMGAFSPENSKEITDKAKNKKNVQDYLGVGGKIEVSPYSILSIPIMMSDTSSKGSDALENIIRSFVDKHPEGSSSVFDTGLDLNIDNFVSTGPPFYASRFNKIPYAILDMSSSVNLSEKLFVMYIHKIYPMSVGLKEEQLLNRIKEGYQKEFPSEFDKDRKRMISKRDEFKKMRYYYNQSGSGSTVGSGMATRPQGSREKSNRGGGKLGTSSYNISNSGPGDIYIDCQPVNRNEEEMMVKMEGYKVTSKFDLFDKTKIKNFFKNPWVQGFILFLVILLLFYIVKMLMAKGKSQGKADLQKGGSKILSNSS